jgi:uncharacterized Zn-finger protein
MFTLGIPNAHSYGAPRLGRCPFTTLMQISDRLRNGSNMADTVVPHFHNTPGAPVIEIGAHEFMCVGELPPLDHPHVFLDMGDASEIICPYCSTLFRHDPTLDPHAARPPQCALPEQTIA